MVQRTESQKILTIEIIIAIFPMVIIKKASSLYTIEKWLLMNTMVHVQITPYHVPFEHTIRIIQW